MFRLKLLTVFWFVFSTCACHLDAQETLTTASISGRVTDLTSAVLSNAQITITQLATNQVQVTQTDSQGRFRLPYLPVGQYVMKVTAQGFAEANRQVQLTVGSAFDISFTLTIGATTAGVEVTAQTPLIEQQRSQTAQTISENESTHLPLTVAITLTSPSLFRAFHLQIQQACRRLLKHLRCLVRDTRSTASGIFQTALL